MSGMTRIAKIKAVYFFLFIFVLKMRSTKLLLLYLVGVLMILLGVVDSVHSVYEHWGDYNLDRSIRIRRKILYDLEKSLTAFFRWLGLKLRKRNPLILNFIALFVVVVSQNKDLVWLYVICVFIYWYGWQYRWKRVRMLFRRR